jgi:putative ABC transport system permease protein
VMQVVGVFDSHPNLGGGGDGTYQLDHKVFVSNTTFRHYFDDTGAVGEIVSRYQQPEDAPLDLRKIARRLSPYLVVRHHGQKTFAFDALDQEDQTVSAVLKALGLVLLACGAIALVVGGVNIMNAQLVTVAERTREFGLRRAIGASAAALRTHVILESLTLSITGGILGIIFGLIGAWGVSALLSRFLGAWPFFSVPWAIGLALAAAAGVGVIAGWLPAARAARLEPAVCLREQ